MDSRSLPVLYRAALRAGRTVEEAEALARSLSVEHAIAVFQREAGVGAMCSGFGECLSADDLRARANAELGTAVQRPRSILELAEEGERFNALRRELRGGL